VAYNFTLIPGDGIGPEITTSAVKVLEAAGVKINWDIVEAGLGAFEKYKDPLPQEVLDSIAKNKIALKGPLTTPIGTSFRSVNVALRKEFELFANKRPAKTYTGIKTLYFDHIDMIIFRENIEEFYSGIEHYIDSSRTAAETIGIVTRKGCERIVRYAFEYAKKCNRKKVTAVHKANIMKYTGGIFLKTAQDIAKEYPEIEFNDKIVDNMAMQMVMNPYQFDVIVTTNLFGDILSDLASGLVGGLGMAPGANIGSEVGIYEAVHGSAPDIAGKNLANPAAIILAAVMMLEDIGEMDASRRVEKAVAKVVADGKFVTRDLKTNDSVGTDRMTEAIIKELEKGK
jgi:isocitrate dehydrogenase (NAD+)